MSVKVEEIKRVCQFLLITHAGDLHTFRLTPNGFIFLGFVTWLVRPKSLIVLQDARECIGTKQNGFVLRPVAK